MNIAIILSGGVGSRLNKDKPKQYIKVEGKPVISYCVETFCNDPRIEEVVICLADEWRDFVQEALKDVLASKPVLYSAPGRTRQFTIYNALENRHCDGVLPVIPVKDTIYMSHDGSHIDALLERNKLFAGQAPESFVFGKYLQAHRNMSDAKLEKISGSTEIAQMAGLNVRLIKGDSMNFKITTPDDLSTFETIVRDRNMKGNR